MPKNPTSKPRRPDTCKKVLSRRVNAVMWSYRRLLRIPGGRCTVHVAQAPTSLIPEPQDNLDVTRCKRLLIRIDNHVLVGADSFPKKDKTALLLRTQSRSFPPFIFFGGAIKGWSSLNRARKYILVYKCNSNTVVCFLTVHIIVSIICTVALHQIFSHVCQFRDSHVSVHHPLPLSVPPPEHGR